MCENIEIAIVPKSLAHPSYMTEHARNRFSRAELKERGAMKRWLLVTYTICLAAAMLVVYEIADSAINRKSRMVQDPPSGNSAPLSSAIPAQPPVRPERPAFPRVAFRCDKYSGPAPLKVKFTNETLWGGSTPASAKWIFCDESKSSEENPEHVFQQPGRYTVLLKPDMKNCKIRPSYYTEIEVTSTDTQKPVDNDAGNWALNIKSRYAAYYLENAIKLTDNSVVLVMNCENLASVVMRIGSNGELLWEKSFSLQDIVIAETPDSCILLEGTSGFYRCPKHKRNNLNASIFKICRNGNIVWSADFKQRYGMCALAADDNNGIHLFSYNGNNANVEVVKLSADGRIENNILFEGDVDGTIVNAAACNKHIALLRMTDGGRYLCLYDCKMNLLWKKSVYWDLSPNCHVSFVNGNIILESKSLENVFEVYDCDGDRIRGNEFCDSDAALYCYSPADNGYYEITEVIIQKASKGSRYIPGGFRFAKLVGESAYQEKYFPIQKAYIFPMFAFSVNKDAMILACAGLRQYEGMFSQQYPNDYDCATLIKIDIQSPDNACEQKTCYINKEYEGFFDNFIDTNLKKYMLSPVSECRKIHSFANMPLLRYNHIGICYLDDMRHFPELTEIDFSYSNIADLSPLSSLQGLRSLKLSYNYLGDCTALSGLNNLTTLDLAGNRISQIESVSGLSNLVWVSFSNNNIAEIPSMSGMTHLSSLDLSWNDIRSLEPLDSLPELETFVLDNNLITDLHPLLIGSFPKLKKVSLAGNPLTAPGVEADIAALRARGILVAR